MKKIFALLLTGVILFSACGNTDEPETELPPDDEIVYEPSVTTDKIVETILEPTPVIESETPARMDYSRNFSENELSAKGIKSIRDNDERILFFGTETLWDVRISDAVYDNGIYYTDSFISAHMQLTTDNYMFLSDMTDRIISFKNEKGEQFSYVLNRDDENDRIIALRVEHVCSMAFDYKQGFINNTDFPESPEWGIPSCILWFDEGVLLIMSSEAESGSFARGGDIYLYSIVTGTSKKFLESDWGIYETMRWNGDFLEIIYSWTNGSEFSRRWHVLNIPRSQIEGAAARLEHNSILFVSYAHDINPRHIENRKPIRFGEGDEKIIILFDTNVRGITLSNVIYDNGVYHTGEEVFRLTWLSTNYYIEYSTTIPGGIPHEVITVTDRDRYRDGITRSYVLSQSGLDGTIAVSEAEVKGIAINNSWIDWRMDEDFTNTYLATMPLVNGAKLIMGDGEYEWSKSIFVKYENEVELVFLRDQFNMEVIRVSPDGTKIAYVDSHGIGFYGELYIFNVLTREANIIEVFNRHELREAPKRVAWLNDEILLVTVGLNQGSVTRGGDVHFYNITTGENRKIIAANDELNRTGYSWAEFSYIEIYDDFLELSVSVSFDSANNHFIYTERIPLNTIHELIASGETLFLDAVQID
jgi:hypothetical protein